MKIPESIKVLGSHLTGAAASFGASVAVTWIARNVTVVATHAAPHFTNSLVQGGAFGFVVNRVAGIVAQNLPRSFDNKSFLVRATAIFGTTGGIAFAATHLAVRAGLIATTLSPVSAIAFTIATAVASYNAPKDKTVIDAIKYPFVTLYDWVKPSNAPEKEPEPAAG